ncbi:MAG: lysylphosphatidylglycerol synthase transmembrane domain-containing protein [Myxococcales bacterium]|jgi:uncharacterized membrane protein YbhN (UPF0104 family)
MKLHPRISRFLRWAIAVIAMGVVVRQLVSDPEPLRRMWAAGPQTLAGMCALVVLNQALMSLRFAQVLNHMGAPRVGFGAWFRITSVGQMLNLFVPQLGNVYRGVALKRDYGISYLTWATGLISFVWLDMVGGVLIAMLAIGVLDPHLRFAGLSAELLLALGLTAIFFGPIAAAFVFERLPPRSGFLGKLQRRLTTLLSTASAAARSPGLMARFFSLNVVVTIGQTATLWLAFHSVGAAIPLSGLLLFQILVKLTSQVVITPGNLGITELAFGALAHGSARTVEQGLAVSLLLRAVGSAMVVLLGALSGGASELFSGRRALLQQGDELAEPDQGFSATKK